MSYATRLVQIVILLGLGVSALPGSASADQYVVDLCKAWDTNVPTTVLPGLSGFGASGEVADCYLGTAAGGVHQLHTAARMSYDTVAGIRLVVPQDRPAISIDRVLTSHRLAAHTGSIAFLRFAAGGALLDNFQGAHDRRDDRVVPAGTRALEWSVYCSYSAGAVPCQWGASDDVLHLYKVRLFLAESSPPSLSIVGGTLSGQAAQSGEKSLVVDAGDVDSGLASLAVKMNDDIVASVAYACAATDWSPCQRVRTGQVLRIDTSRLPDGEYGVSVIARDAANNTAIRSAGDVTITNGEVRPPFDDDRRPGAPPAPSAMLGPGIPNGVPASRRASLAVKYSGAGRRGRGAIVRFRDVLRVRGRVTDERSTPIRGATIAVQGRQRRAGARRVHLAAVTTDHEGWFVYRVPPGASRTITFAYTAFGGDQPAARASVVTTVRASIADASFSPRAPRAYERTRFRGRLQYLPRSNVQVAIQFRDGRRWRTIGLTQTRRGGWFTWFYRFTRASPGDVFEFRAHVSSPIYPFAAGNSRTVDVPITG